MGVKDSELGLGIFFLKEFKISQVWNLCKRCTTGSWGFSEDGLSSSKVEAEWAWKLQQQSCHYNCKWFVKLIAIMFFKISVMDLLKFNLNLMESMSHPVARTYILQAMSLSIETFYFLFDVVSTASLVIESCITSSRGWSVSTWYLCRCSLVQPPLTIIWNEGLKACNKLHWMPSFYNCIHHLLVL